MSRFSGKCDVYDALIMLERKDNETDLDCFERIKQLTGGFIYQYVPVELNRFNIDIECLKSEKNNLFSLQKIKHTQVKEDKRCKTGKREIITYTYKYLNKEFDSLEEINKIGYVRKDKIKLTTLLDFVKYFPYLVGAMSSSKDYMYVEISNKSYVETSKLDSLKYGYDFNEMEKLYNEELKEYYIDLIKKDLK